MKWSRKSWWAALLGAATGTQIGPFATTDTKIRAPKYKRGRPDKETPPRAFGRPGWSRGTKMKWRNRTLWSS